MTEVLRPDTLSVDGSPLERTLAGAVKDRQMVTPEGKNIASLVEGVSTRDLTTHTDGRGTVIPAGSGTRIRSSSPIASR